MTNVGSVEVEVSGRSHTCYSQIGRTRGGLYLRFDRRTVTRAHYICGKSGTRYQSGYRLQASRSGCFGHGSKPCAYPSRSNEFRERHALYESKVESAGRRDGDYSQLNSRSDREEIKRKSASADFFFLPYTYSVFRSDIHRTFRCYIPSIIPCPYMRQGSIHTPTSQ